jgi:hypothetical protein
VDQERLIAIVAGVASHRAASLEEVRRIGASTDWDTLAEALGRRGLLVTLGPRVLELTGERADRRFAEQVDAAVVKTRRQAGLLELTGERLREALTKAGITARTIKGPALARRVWGDSGRRLSNDIDLLVGEDDLDEAAAVVRAFGYSSPADHLERDGLPRLHLALAHERGTLPPVELHWRVHWYERHFARERLLDVTPAQENTDRALAAELASLLLFYARDGFLGLRLASDISAWWDTFGEQMSAEALPDLLGAYPRLKRALAGGAMAAERTVGLPGGRLLGLSMCHERRCRTAARLANPNPRASEAQLNAAIGLIDGLLMPDGDGRAFIRRQLLIPREVLDQRAAQRTGRPTRRRRFYPLRLVRRAGIVARYAIELSRLARRQELSGSA